MKRTLSFVVMMTAFAGCDGLAEFRFRDEQSFNRYVQSMALDTKSVSEGSALLSAKGFRCESSVLPNHLPGAVDCLRGVGSQSLMVTLAPLSEGKTYIRSSRTLVFM